MQLTTASAYRRPRTSANGHLQIEMDSLGTFRRYDADETVYCQGGAADYWYRIVDGAARQCTQISDGRRQIMDFRLPGDLFGFDASTRHECSVECVASNTTVARYQRQKIESLMESDPPLARRMREIAFGSIDRLQSRMICWGAAVHWSEYADSCWSWPIGCRSRLRERSPCPCRATISRTTSPSQSKR
jgi:hypothetical protein